MKLTVFLLLALFCFFNQVNQTYTICATQKYIQKRKKNSKNGIKYEDKTRYNTGIYIWEKN